MDQFETTPSILSPQREMYFTCWAKHVLKGYQNTQTKTCFAKPTSCKGRQLTPVKSVKLPVIILTSARTYEQ